MAAAHKYLISSVAWYPVDTGMFVTGSHDCAIKVWDTNAMDVVCEFVLPKKVSSVAMSAATTSHCLVAAGCEDTHVRMCDPTSGVVTHVFAGHRHPVWCVAWAAHSGYEVLSGDGGGAVRVWDIRRAGCRAVLDQYSTQRAAADEDAEPLPQPAASPSKKQRRAVAGVGKGPSAAPSLRGSASAPTLLPPPPEREAPAAPRMKDSAIRAHAGAVTAVLPCPDGLHLLTAGTDGRLRLWDAALRHNLLVGYEGAHNSALRARHLAVTPDARVAFYPTGSSINVYEVASGATLRSLQRGHTESINCVAYNPALQELYSGANDKSIRVWGIGPGGEDEEEGEEEEEEGVAGRVGGGRYAGGGRGGRGTGRGRGNGRGRR